MVKLSLPKELVQIGIADVVGSGISAGFWFFLATLIKPDEYGEIAYYTGIAGLLSYISLIGTQNVITVYSAKNFKIQKTFYSISLLIGVVCSLAIIILFHRIDAVLLLFGYIINTLVVGDLLGKKLYSSYSKYALAQKILSLIFGICFYYIFGVNGILYAFALSYSIFIARVYRGFRESRFDFSFLRSHAGFIANNYTMSIVGGVTGQIDKIIIASLLGFAVLGHYNLALQVVLVLISFSNIVFKYTLSHDASGNQNIKLKKLTVFVSVVITIIGITLSPLIIPIAFPKYIDVIGAIQIMSLDVIATTITHIYTSRLLGLEKSKFVIAGTSLALFIMIVSILILGPMFGMIGISVAFVLSASTNATFLICASRLR